METKKEFKNTVEVRVYFDQKNMELREGFEQKKLNLQNEYNKGERARKDRLCEFKKQLELENERQTAYAKAKALQDSWVADTAPLHD